MSMSCEWLNRTTIQKLARAASLHFPHGKAPKTNELKPIVSRWMKDGILWAHHREEKYLVESQMLSFMMRSQAQSKRFETYADLLRCELSAHSYTFSAALRTRRELAHATYQGYDEQRIGRLVEAIVPYPYYDDHPVRLSYMLGLNLKEDDLWVLREPLLALYISDCTLELAAGAYVSDEVLLIIISTLVNRLKKKKQDQEFNEICVALMMRGKRELLADIARHTAGIHQCIASFYLAIVEKKTESARDFARESIELSKPLKSSKPRILGVAECYIALLLVTSNLADDLLVAEQMMTFNQRRDRWERNSDAVDAIISFYTNGITGQSDDWSDMFIIDQWANYDMTLLGNLNLIFRTQNEKKLIFNRAGLEIRAEYLKESCPWFSAELKEIAAYQKNKKTHSFFLSLHQPLEPWKLTLKLLEMTAESMKADEKKRRQRRRLSEYFG